MCLLSGLSERHSCSFRIRPKVHKPVLSSRPVANLRHAWVQQQPSSWLCAYLQQLQALCKTVVASAGDFLRQLLAVDLTAIDDGDDPLQLMAFDIEELYPSIEHDHMLSHIISFVTSSEL